MHSVSAETFIGSPSLLQNLIEVRQRKPSFAGKSSENSIQLIDPAIRGSIAIATRRMTFEDTHFVDMVDRDKHRRNMRVSRGVEHRSKVRPKDLRRHELLFVGRIVHAGIEYDKARAPLR